MHGTLRVGLGAQVCHVHAGFESRYEREIVLDVVGGRVRDRRELTPVGAMGMAGPYRLDKPLFGELLSGDCASMLRYLNDGPEAAASWVDELLDAAEPPE